MSNLNLEYNKTIQLLYLNFAANQDNAVFNWVSLDLPVKLI